LTVPQSLRYDTEWVLTYKRRLTADARRQAILAAAKSAFGAHGYHATTTRDIAAAARVSEALLYQHFDGKRQLFEAVVHTAAGDLERRIEAATEGADPLSHALEAFFDFVEEEAALYRVFFRQALQADPAFEHLYTELSGRLLDLVGRSLGREGLADARRAEMVAHALGGMVGELALWWLETRTYDRDRMVAQAARMGRAIYLSEVEDGS
jgi:AcrR family transcriptional regulator